MLSLFMTTLSISCLSAYEQDFQDFQDWQEFKEYKKNREKKAFADRQMPEDKKCCEQEMSTCQDQERYEYLEYQDYRRNQEMDNNYCKDLQKMRLCEVSQIDPNKDRLEDFKVSCDWLYFKAVQESLPFSVSVPDSIDMINSSYFGGSLSEPKWKYSSGVRIGAGIPTGLGNWELGASWSYVSNKASRSKTSSNYKLFTLASAQDLDITGDSLANYAKGNWKLNFNTADITLESPIYINNSLKLRPIIGVQGASIQQKTNVKYSDFNQQLLVIANPPQKLHGKNNTWGVGPKLGLGIAVAMPCEWNFNFLASFASLFGKGKSKVTYSSFVNLMVTPQEVISAPNNTISWDTTRLFSMIQLQGSVEKVWDFDCASLGVSVGWEAQTWLRQQRLVYYGTVVDPSQGSDLTLQGPFARVSLDF